MSLPDFDTLTTQLEALDSNVGTALAAACADRVYRVYEEYWFGDYTPAVKEAIEVGWTYACGASIDANHLTLITADLQETVEYLNEEGVTILASSATVSLRIIQSITSDTAGSALAVARALESALYVALLAGDLSGVDQGDKAAELEEVSWQAAALRIVEAWREPCRRDMFEGIGVSPPLWWTTYQSGSEHL
jgi:hypothetical protein